MVREFEKLVGVRRDLTREEKDNELLTASSSERLTDVADGHLDEFWSVDVEVGRCGKRGTANRVELIQKAAPKSLPASLKMVLPGAAWGVW
jgi:hypothetical protein